MWCHYLSKISFLSFLMAILNSCVKHKNAFISETTVSAHLEWWQNLVNMLKGSDLHPKDHNIQIFNDTSNLGWDAHLEQDSAKGLLTDREKRLHINVLELKAVFLTQKRFRNQCQNQTVLVATQTTPQW